MEILGFVVIGFIIYSLFFRKESPAETKSSSTIDSHAAASHTTSQALDKNYKMLLLQAAYFRVASVRLNRKVMENIENGVTDPELFEELTHATRSSALSLTNLAPIAEKLGLSAPKLESIFVVGKDGESRYVEVWDIVATENCNDMAGSDIIQIEANLNRRLDELLT